MNYENELRVFLEERPAINHTIFANECKIDRVNFSKILKGIRKIPKPKRGQVLRTMEKYGYKIPEK